MGAAMTSPSPFMVAREASTNLGEAFTRVRDENAIEQILSSAMNSGNPEMVQDSIGKILSQVSPERQGMAVQYLQGIYQNIKQKQDQQKRKETAIQVGVNPDLPESLQKIQYENQLLDQRARNIVGATPIGNIQQQPSGAIAPGVLPEKNIPNVPQPNQIGVLWRDLTDDQLVQLSGVKGFAEPAKQELKKRQEERNITQRKEENKIKFGQDIGKKVLERADEIAETLPQKEAALNIAKQAIVDGNLGFFTRDNLAELFGIEGLRSKEGAVFKTSMKEFLLGSLVRAGSRPNQWIEQQISDMAAKIGRSPEANLSVVRAIQNEIDIEKERIRLTDEISDQITNTTGDYKKLGAMINTRLAKYAEQKQNELYNDLRAIKSIGENTPQKFHKVQLGTPITPYMVDALLVTFDNDDVKAMEEAKRLGYSFDE